MRNFYILIQGNKFILDKKSNSLQKNIKVNTGNGTKEIFSGQRIEEKDLYNIVPTTNLKITPVFKWTLSSGKLEDMIENNKIKTVEDALNLELESAENIRNILGPFYYLRQI